MASNKGVSSHLIPPAIVRLSSWEKRWHTKVARQQTGPVGSILILLRFRFGIRLLANPFVYFLPREDSYHNHQRLVQVQRDAFRAQKCISCFLQTDGIGTVAL